MKRTILTAALIAAMGTATFATGNNGDGSKASLVKSPDQTRFNLIYTGAAPGKVQVKVYDEKGRLLRTDKINNVRGFKQPYDMSDLEPGTYKIVVSDSAGETSLLANVLPTEEIAVNKLANNKFQLIYRDSSSEKASVGIYNKNGELLFSEDISFKKGFSKVYDLSKITSGGLTFEVSANHKSRKVSF